MKKRYRKVLDEDYSPVLQWLEARLNEVWDERGAFPGLGAMLCAMKVKYGILVAKEITEKAGNGDLWAIVDQAFTDPERVLSPSLARGIDGLTQRVWNDMPQERKQLFKLLSRFNLTMDQAEVIFQTNQRQAQSIPLTDANIIRNPYLLYEGTRLKANELSISVKSIDRAVFPVESIRRRYPIEAPTALTADNDVRRIRALAVYVLEQAAESGSTILPGNVLMDRIQALPLQPECAVTLDHLSVMGEELSSVITIKEMENGEKYYKLQRYEGFDREIERKVRKKLGADRIDLQADWGKLLDDYLKKKSIPNHPDAEKEKRIRREKTAALKELAESRVSVLVGDAGTGKTTVLAVLCSHPNIAREGVLLLAPTGKATVRLMDSMVDSGSCFEAYNIAQFLSRQDIQGFVFEDMRFQLPKGRCGSYGTVIVDESSMLTEDMLGSLMKAVGASKRIIFVGDSNQLPPIGAGRPFVDLIRILKPDYSGVFPRVCQGYCELVENCRQASAGERLDAEFAKVFTSAESDSGRSIINEILRGQSEEIRILRWDGKDDLHEKLFRVLAKEFGITDQASFDRSLGGNRGKYGEPYSYFNAGCASFVEKWQLLSPVYNMPQGVSNLNHLIHTRFRSENIALAGKRGKSKKIASPWGHESIVYGDKVINVRNMRKTGYPKGTCRNYIANGEIGIACGDYKSDRAWDDDSLRVEFSSQKKNYYFYNWQNFNEERGTNDLELAYALTVHKAQGSQFDTVILVLAEPCRLLSREMLYTALTRQKEKIIILYNQDPHRLMDYSSPHNSDIAQRFTDLFTDLELPGQANNKPCIVKVGNRFYDDRLIHRTTRGELVRSKSEVIIADHLLSNGIPYDYEPEVTINCRVFRPDFIAYDPDDDGVFWYWEHVGMPTDAAYMARWKEKLVYYHEHGIREGKNLIVTYDGDNGGLDSRAIDELIKDAFQL